jgi:hypothetical protein
MNDFIKNLQSKPNHTKNAIMWFSIIIIMSAIFTFWIMTFSSQLPASETNESTEKFQKDLPSVWESLKNQVNEIKNLWQK